jgi:hypothetical protein
MCCVLELFLFHYFDSGSFRAQEPFQGLKFTQFYGLSRALQNQQNGDEIIFDFSFSSWRRKRVFGELDTNDKRRQR